MVHYCCSCIIFNYVHMDKIKIYKPGQIISIKGEDNKLHQYRITEHQRGRLRCLHCNASDDPTTMLACTKYCCKQHNNWNKYPHGYILKEIRRA